jgi:hypothetical protein
MATGSSESQPARGELQSAGVNKAGAARTNERMVSYERPEGGAAYQEFAKVSQLFSVLESSLRRGN